MDNTNKFSSPSLSSDSPITPAGQGTQPPVPQSPSMTPKSENPTSPHTSTMATNLPPSSTSSLPSSFSSTPSTNPVNPPAPMSDSPKLDNVSPSNSTAQTTPQTPVPPSRPYSPPQSPPKPQTTVESAILPPLGKKNDAPTTAPRPAQMNNPSMSTTPAGQGTQPPVPQTPSIPPKSENPTNPTTPTTSTMASNLPPTPPSSPSSSFTSTPSTSPVNPPTPTLNKDLSSSNDNPRFMQGLVSESPKSASSFNMPQPDSTLTKEIPKPSTNSPVTPTPIPSSSPVLNSTSNNIPPLPPQNQSVSSVIASSPPPSRGKGKLLGILLFFLIVISAGVGAVYWFMFRPGLGNNDQNASLPTTITYWGLWEPESVMKPIIEEYQAQNPNVKINYENSSPIEYAQRLRNALASETPPDIFRMHNTWPYMFPNLLSQIPEDIYTQEEYAQTFYPVALKNLTVDGKLIGIPLMYDGLALFYNVELFNRAGIENPPTDWEQFVTVARKITAPQEGNLEISGAAMGTAKNISHWPDIMSLLLLQNDANPGNLTTANGQLNSNATDALTFYSLFSYRYKTWDDKWPQDNQQFALGKVGMFFGPSWEVFNIKNIAQRNNVNIDFRVIPVPQLLPETNTTFASFWAEGVSAKSKNQLESWKFLKYLSSKEVMQKMYDEQSKVREFGEIPSRRDMAEQYMDHPYMGAYLKQAPAAKTFPLVSGTTDKDGINDRINKAYEQAVIVASGGTSASSALQPTAKEVVEVLKTYGLAQ